MALPPPARPAPTRPRLARPPLGALLLAAWLCPEAARADTGADEAEGPRRRESREALLRRVHALEARVVELEAGPPGDGKIVRRGDLVEQAVGLGVPVDVWGEVDGDVVAVGADVIVHRGATVRGDAVSLGGEVRVLEGGAVRGAPITLRPPPPMARRGLRPQLSYGLGFGAAGVLTAGLWPGRARRMAAKLRAGPLGALAAGMLALTLLPVLAMAFAITVIGLPIAAFIVLGGLVAAMLGAVSAAEALGERLMPRLSPWAATALGALLLGALGQLPWVGRPLLMAAWVAGLGAALRSRAGRAP